MERNILKQYKNALARINILRMSIKNVENKKNQMNRQGYYVTDVVNMGKKGKKPLGTIIVAGFPHDEYKKMCAKMEERRTNLKKEEKKLIELTIKTEEYIAGIEDIEIRNIFTLYYIENLTWIKVAHEMNRIYKEGKYTEDSCRHKHDRFIEKNF